MSNEYRRYEILLPLRFNDGSPIPDEAIGQTLQELRERFGAVSSETQTIQGVWEQQGQIYRDDLTRIFVDVPDTPQNRTFFADFKQILKNRFQQLEIWMTTHPIDVI